MYFSSQGAPLEASTISQTFSRTYLHRVKILDDDDEKRDGSESVDPNLGKASSHATVFLILYLFIGWGVG